MSVPLERPLYSIADYYRMENDATQKHEYRDGEILAMSGGSPEHALIALNLGAEFRTRLKGKPCRPYSSDLRVRVVGAGRTMYPDLTVICGEIEYDPDDKAKHTILNPKVLVEVLSPSTEAYDRGDKFDAYRRIPSLVEYVLVAYSEARVDSFHRQSDGTWQFWSAAGSDAVAVIRSLQIELPLAEIYAGIAFPPPQVR